MLKWFLGKKVKVLVVTVLVGISFAPLEAMGMPGDFIVTELNANKLSRITPEGVRTVIFDFGAGVGPNSVAIERSGDFIVATGNSKLLRITAEGVVTEIFTFSFPGQPDRCGVAIGAREDFIVAESFSHKLSRITPAGVRTEIFTFGGGIEPRGVAIDVNGDFIVTEAFNSHKLSRIT